MPLENIVVKGAREHNLQSVDVTIPRNKLVVITGVSGSGKSSLAFDTIYAEGQRRYVESLSAYARQFLGLMEKPNVEYIEGLSPAISIDQKGVSHNPRSTVGTVTEIYDYLRLLFARIGHVHCYKCGRQIERQTIQQIVDSIIAIPQNSYVMLLSPLVRARKGEYKEVFEDARKAGFVRVRVDGEIYDLANQFNLDRYKNHTIEVIVDRLVIDENLESLRIADSVETALRLSGGIVQTVNVETGAEQLYSEQFSCIECGISLPEIEPRTFSFNSPHGACGTCTGLGYRLEVDPKLVIPNQNLTIAQGAVMPWARAGTASKWYASLLASLAEEYDFSTRIPVSELKQEHLDLVLYGNGGIPLHMKHRTRRGHELNWDSIFEGVIPNLQRRYKQTESEFMRHEIERYMAANPCPSCEGNRLRPESLAVTVTGKNIRKVTGMSILQATEWVKDLQSDEISNSRETVQFLSAREKLIANQIIKEIDARLKFLLNIGLDYLSLDRSARTLSGGESQRIRLATQIGSGLMGVLYVCDEPSVGLHPIDSNRLIKTLKEMRDLGNTVLIVEHDETIMRSADHILDLGPGAGEHGGKLVAQGEISDIIKSQESVTGAYLSGKRKIDLPKQRRLGNGQSLTIRGARENNLNNIDVPFPLGKLICVTGVSGSGKSSLVYDILYKKMSQLLYLTKDRPGDCDDLEGVIQIDKVVNIDQSPIGRTPRSNPATYVGAFTAIRELFALTPEARMRGYTPGRFSFNVKGGRCESCRGEGYTKIEMQFLPDVEIPCDICHGQRYNREALEVHFKDNTIADVLNMTVGEALEFFEAFPKIKTKLATMRDVGLGYIRLGQPATTLSGGEAQRVKLSTELSRRATGKTLYILDEPTTGLSFPDCDALLGVLHRLVDSGNTVILVEHHLDMIKNADWIIDLGPGAGDRGGKIVAQGTPETIAKTRNSFTGQFLAPLLTGKQN